MSDQPPLRHLEELLSVSIGGVWGADPGIQDVDVHVFRSTELTHEGDLNVKTAVVRSVSARQLGSRRLQPGDLLLEKSGGGPNTPVGRVGFVRALNGPSVCSNFMQLMRPDTTKVEPRYLHYFLTWFHQSGSTAAFQSNSTNIRNLRTPDYVRTLVPVPPLAEQQRIVAKLDELSEIHAELATCYASAVEQTKAIWVSALNHELEPKDSWTPVTLGDVATFHNGRAYKKEELLASGKYRVLRVGNFFSSDSWYWSDLELDPTKYCVHGDLLYAWSASFGPRIWDGDKTIYHYHIWKVVEDSSLIGRMFLKFWLEADVERVKAASGTGTTMMHVSKGSIEAREIRVPPLSLQRAIVEKLEEVQKGLSLLVDVHSKRLEAAQNLRRSVLAAAFRGDL